MTRPKNGFKTVKTALKYISTLPFSEKRKVVAFAQKLLNKQNGKKSVMKYFAIRLPQIVAKGIRTADAVVLDTINKVTAYTF